MAEITDLKAFLVFMLPTFVVVAVIGLRDRLISDEFETHNIVIVRRENMALLSICMPILPGKKTSGNR